MTSFKDHFSTAPDRYAAYRPEYPAALFEWLAGRCASHNAVWDCATGNGQAATGLAVHFERVIATDASAAQIAHARRDVRIEFRVAPAEASGLDDRSVDLVTVAQAVHWFDLPRFYAEAARVLKPGGLLAVWGYGRVALPEALDARFAHFYADTLGPYWPPERALIDDGYRNLEFPFVAEPAPGFEIEVEWTLDRLLDYVATWSAVQRYRATCDDDPVAALRHALWPLWPTDARTLPLRWPVFVRAGRSSVT